MSRSHDATFPTAWHAAERQRDDHDWAGDTPATQSDELLAKAVARGDELALTELIGRYERRLTEFIRWSLDDASDMTEDVLQEVFLQVHRSAFRFAGQSSFKTWLYALTRNVCRHETRKLRRQPAWSAESAETLRDVPSEELGPLDAMTNAEVLTTVRRAVESLPSSYRLVLLLRDWEDLSYAEIADVLELPVGTVRSRLHNARALLSDRLGEYLK